MNVMKRTEKARDAINAYLNQIDSEPALLASMLSVLPGHVQYRLWKMVKFLIKEWAKRAQYQEFDPQYVAIYKWAERVDNVTIER